MRRTLLSTLAASILAAGIASGLGSGPAVASESPAPPSQQWAFQGPFGTFDRTAIRRGLQVYLEVCASCHSLNLVSYRHLTGIGLTPNEVRAVAAAFEVTDGPNDQGDMFTRPARAADRFAQPFPNPQAARAANGGALPPDLSLMTKARKNGADYLYALMTGYKDSAPAGFQMMPGMSYNAYFPGHQIAMPTPLAEDRVTYPNQTKATVEQMARDVTTFLSWAAEPEMEERKRLGIKVMLFLIVLTGMLYALKRKIWADVH